MVRQFGLSALLLGAVALAACGGQPATGKPAGGASSAQAVTVKSLDTMKFDPATITVRANSPVGVTLDNSGAGLVHDFVIDNLGGTKVHIEAQPNQKATGQFTPTAPGTYQFYCAQPGHKEAGMVGTLTVN
jgi:uncharacterized cupredoxin-like copper-binding protein